MKQSFEHNNRVIEYNLIRSKRKNLEIQINGNGVRVISPEGIKNEEVATIVKQKGNWICEKLDEIRANPLNNTNVNYCEGELILFLGNIYRIKLKIDERLMNLKIELKEDYIVITSYSSDSAVIKGALEAWYRMQAKKEIDKYIIKYQKALKLEPRNIAIKSQKKRWGSCSSNRDINFNWKCIMAPTEVIEYLVVHEMCHLIHMNHSKEYWEQVREVMPNYEIYKKWLRDNGIHLDF